VESTAQVSHDPAASEPTGAETIADVWPVIADVLCRELHAYPELLDRVLIALANARSPQPEHTAAAGLS
jgi:hypothetical protein